jgi:RimJ/RimL family protein N-acetyltransferase
MTTELPAGYEIRELTAEQFLPLWRRHRDRFFAGVAFRLDPGSAPPPQRWRLALGSFKDDEFVGWTVGHQIDASRFEMYNSAVFEAHRGLGLYRALVTATIDRVFAAGYTTVTSRHHPNNAAVLIPKLKCGFVISGLFVDPSFGTLVELSRYATPLQRSAFDYRVGLIPMDESLAGASTTK